MYDSVVFCYCGGWWFRLQCAHGCMCICPCSIYIILFFLCVTLQFIFHSLASIYNHQKERFPSDYYPGVSTGSMMEVVHVPYSVKHACTLWFSLSISNMCVYASADLAFTLQFSIPYLTCTVLEPSNNSLFIDIMVSYANLLVMGWTVSRRG